MSYVDYVWARKQMGRRAETELERHCLAGTASDPPFYGIIMLASMRADTFNLARLEAAWPDTVAEARARYNAPAGLLESDPPALRARLEEELAR